MYVVSVDDFALIKGKKWLKSIHNRNGNVDKAAI